MFTPEQAALVADLVAWALDQDHDAQGMGDPDYLYFLVNEEAGQTVEDVRRLLDEILARVTQT